MTFILHNYKHHYVKPDILNKNNFFMNQNNSENLEVFYNPLIGSSLGIPLNLLQYIECEIITVLSDVTNMNMVESVISKNNIHTIYHAAAYKHVPMVEKNIVEGVFNNIMLQL